LRYRSNAFVGTLTQWRPTLRSDLESLARRVVERRWTRALANLAYHGLTSKQAEAIHEAFGNVFKDRENAFRDGIWSIRFCGRTIRVPLQAQSLALDWGIALAMLGHDVEVKQTYAALIKSAAPPDLFLDVGSNFGTHSILFQAHGIDTMSFDPNPGCNAYHMRLAAANGLQPRIEPVAIGEQPGQVNLAFPPDQPWLGSTDAEIGVRLKTEYAVETCAVEQRTVDAYLSRLTARHLLLKIDTEGNECAVLAGAAQTLRDKQPTVIFECWSGPERDEIHRLLTESNYSVMPLPWDPRTSPQMLDVERFRRSAGMNFLALPLSRA
jgi:FkbM family methyltransferase